MRSEAIMAELEKLDAYLSADRASEKCMQLSDLDGFLAGVICSPNLIPPSTWLPVAMGTSENVGPWVIVHLRGKLRQPGVRETRTKVTFGPWKDGPFAKRAISGTSK